MKSMRLVCVFFVLACVSTYAQLSVSLTPSLASPQPVGTPIVFTASASGGSGNYDYQFSANLTTSQQQIKQDFNMAPAFGWTPSAKEGQYTIAVVARDLANKNSRASAAAQYTVTTALNRGKQAVHPTANTLVALFSAPACPVGQTMRVVFLKAGQTAVKSATNEQPCDAVTSMNFYIAGMYPNTAYNMLWQTLDATGVQVATGNPMQFTTGAIPADISLPAPPFVAAGSPNQTDPDQTYPVIVHLFTPGFSTNYSMAATDLEGNYLWYTPHTYVYGTRTDTGGGLFTILAPNIVQSSPNPYAQQLLEIDLAGNVLIDTNAEIVSEQLAANGKHPITAFSHEARRLANGDILFIGTEERLIANSFQCGSTGGVPNTCDVLGDEVIVLDSNLQYKWSWDGFDDGTYTTSQGSFQLVNDKAILGETCVPNQGGCPAFYLAPIANDWTHSNSSTLTADGNIILSMRHLDWILKINYAKGAGDRHIMWRMGNNGDFGISTVNTQGSTMDLATFPWFSHQHDPEFAFHDRVIHGAQILAVYDDGNTRIAHVDPNGHSRGQIYAVDEAALKVNVNVNTDLGVYAVAVGTAQILPNGNYWFQSGLIISSNHNPYVQEAEAGKNGDLLFVLQITHGNNFPDDALEYRAFRLPTLYFETP